MKKFFLLLVFIQICFGAILQSKPSKFNNQDAYIIKLENEYESIGFACNKIDKSIPMLSINFDNENVENSKVLSLNIDGKNYTIPKQSDDGKALAEDRVKWNEFINAFLDAKEISFLKPSTKQIVVFNINDTKKFDKNATKEWCVINDSNFLTNSVKNIWNYTSKDAFHTFFINDGNMELILECGAKNDMQISYKHKSEKISNNLYVSIDGKKKIKIPTIKALKDFDADTDDYDKSYRLYERQMKNWEFLTKRIAKAKNLKFYDKDNKILLDLEPKNQNSIIKQISEVCK